MSAIVEEIFNKVNTHKGVEGIILSDAEGIPIKSTFNDEQTTYFYTTSASMFIKKCRNIAKELINEDLNIIRIRTKLNEIMIAPEDNFILIVVQNPAANA
jgi:dynein light chain roadblock-type